jgi:hypoxanthine phosphoribosyltransferase
MRQLSYNELKAIAKDVAKYIDTKKVDCELVAVTRGGLTFAHLVAYNLAKPLHFFNPKLGQLILADDISLHSHFIFLEDLIAEGRTFRLISDYMNSGDWHASWEMIPVVLDSKAPPDIQDRVNTYGIRTDDWIVFPHEDIEHTREGDRGLFREGTSENAKPSI